MWTTVSFLLLAVAAGALISLQSAVNGQLGQALGSTVLAAFVSFLGGTLALSLVLLARSPWTPLTVQGFANTPPLLYLGGVFGATY